MRPEVTFGKLTLDEHSRAEIRDALRRIRSDGPGAWPEPVEHVEVTRLLDGGRSGAVVAQVYLHRGDHRLMHVVKIDSVTELTREWRAYQRWIGPTHNVLFARILAATPEVITNAPGDDWGKLAALVYDHVGQHAGAPEAEIRTLEEVVRAAAGDPEATELAVRTINDLFGKAGQVLYRRNSVRKAPISLRSLNPALGRNVTLTVNGIDTTGSLHYGPLDPARSAAARLPHDEVLVRTLGDRPQDELVPGQLLALTGLRPHRFDGSLIAHGDDIVVEIHIEPGSAHLIAPLRLLDQKEIAVCGLITATRGKTHRDRLAAAAGELADEFGKVFADPFSALRQVLTVPTTGRVSSVVHGDLNPRNILLAEGNPYLIDYAHTSDDRPQQADFCWLELGLLRDVFAAQGFPAMIGLHSVLAFASQLLALNTPSNEIEELCLALFKGPTADLHTPFRLLWAIRLQAWSHHPARSAEPWPRGYLEQLLIEAHRTVKWTEEDQTADKLRATIAAASVASEWLGGGNPFRFWTADALSEVLRATVPLLRFGEDRAVQFFADLVTALESHGRVSRSLEAVAAAYRAGVVRDRCSAEAGEIARRLSAHHDTYVDLTGTAIAADHTRVAIVGGPGSGKTAAAKELAYQLATKAIVGSPSTGQVRIPFLIRAAEFVSTTDVDRTVREFLSRCGLGTVAEAALVLGAVHLIVDDMDELAPAAQLELTTALEALQARYPRVPLLLCLRHPKQGLATVRLRDLDPVAVHRILHKAVDPVMRSADVDTLLAALLDNPRWRRSLRQPAAARLIADHLTAGGSPDTMGGPADTLVERLVGTGDHADVLSTRCEELAATLLNDQAPDLSAETARKMLGADELDRLVARGVLRQDGTSVRFAERSYQDVFGARSLVREPRYAGERVLRQSWHEACLLFASLPSAPGDAVTAMARKIAGASPVLAGRLLHAGQRELPGFAETQAATLGDTDAGPQAWRNAAEALFSLGDETGRSALAQAVTNVAATGESRREALVNLAELHDRALSSDERRTTARVLVSALHLVFTRPSPAELRADALDVLGKSRLRGLELCVAGFVDPAMPWPVTREAMKALRGFGMAVPQPLEDAYRAACLARVAELERNPAAAAREAREHRAELIDLAGELSATQDVTWLLHRRFAFGLSAVVAERLDELPASNDTGHERVFAGTVQPERWLDLVDTAERAVAEAAAHRLLRDVPELAEDLIARTPADAPSYRLLITAAAIEQSRPVEIEPAEEVFSRLVPVLDAERLAGAAALLCAIFSVRRRTGIRLAWKASVELARHDVPERHHRPWVTAMARARGSLADFDAMLCDDDESAALATSALASYGFHREAGPKPGHAFSPAAKARLLGLQPPPGAPANDIIQWILATATIGLADALRPVRTLMKGLGPEVAEYASSRHGMFSQALLADALTVTGYLARLAADQHIDIGDTYRMLREFDTAGAPESVETGRLLGLAYLGDWKPLLTALPSGDRVVSAARTTIELWTPGPCTPTGNRDHRDMAEWIAHRLRDPDLPKAHRWALAELKEAAQQRAGVLVP